jgi:hypothetical protein
MASLASRELPLKDMSLTMTTDRLAFLNLAVVDDDLTLGDTRSALLKPPGGTAILAKMWVLWRTHWFLAFPGHCSCRTVSPLSGTTLITFVQADRYNLNLIQ